MKHLLLSMYRNLVDVTVALAVVLVTSAFVGIPTYHLLGLLK